MKEELLQLRTKILAEIAGAEELNRVREIDIKYLGRKGKLTTILRGLKDLSDDKKREIGALANKIKKEAASALKEKEQKILSTAKISRHDFVDVTVPGIKPPEGHLHLTTLAINEIEDIFKRMGFYRVRYPEVEYDYYAFESLNMPPDHPARDEWETFFITPNIVLTPHTSSGQAREMEKKKFPIRMINISKCYRRQSDVSHVPMFHQFEGLYIDKNVAVTNLKGVIDYFVKQFFGPDREIRLRPYHFRFTEPSFEIDISCGICHGKGVLENGEKCRLCKEGWLELGGAGMVHPNVLKASKVDINKYNGFAFGWGVERTFMMKSGIKIDDIRILYKNDLRFLEQF